jgi:hypothetical protein
MSSLPWSAQEDQILTKLYIENRMKFKEIADSGKINRTAGAIRGRASFLGLKKSNAETYHRRTSNKYEDWKQRK